MDTFYSYPYLIGRSVVFIAALLFSVTSVAVENRPKNEGAAMSQCGCNIDEQHLGQDWTAPVGTSVPVAHDGVVIKIEEERKSNSCGKFIVVKHEYLNGKVVFSRYAQLGRIVGNDGKPVVVGQILKERDKIGAVGEKGTLHFEVRPVRGDQADIQWSKINPVDPNIFNFESGMIQISQTSPWDTYVETDIDAVINKDVDNKHDLTNGVDIWTPIRKMRISVILLDYPKACDVGFLGRTLAVNGISLNAIPPISTCIRIKSTKGKELTAFIQDQVGKFLLKEIKLGSRVDLFVNYLYANTVSNSLGLVVNEFQVQ